MASDAPFSCCLYDVSTASSWLGSWLLRPASAPRIPRSASGTLRACSACAAIHSRNHGYDGSFDGISSVMSMRLRAASEPSFTTRRRPVRTMPRPCYQFESGRGMERFRGLPSREMRSTVTFRPRQYAPSSLHQLQSTGWHQHNCP